MAEPIEMPFGLWARMGPRNHVLHGRASNTYLLTYMGPWGPDTTTGRGNFVGEMAAHCEVYGLSAVSCAETA